MARKARKTIALKKTRKFGGKRYAKKATHKLKTSAKKSAVSARNKGKKARISKSKKGWTLYTRG